MAQLQKSVATLRLFGENLIPEDITQVLGCEPTASYTKGDVRYRDKTGKETIARQGMWRVDTPDCEPADLDKQVAELLGKVTQDLSVWERLAKNYSIDIYCGLFLKETNEAFWLSPITSMALGHRGIEIIFELYCPIPELRPDDPCPCGSGKTYKECCGPESDKSGDGE